MGFEKKKRWPEFCNACRLTPVQSPPTSQCPTPTCSRFLPPLNHDADPRTISSAVPSTSHHQRTYDHDHNATTNRHDILARHQYQGFFHHDDNSRAILKSLSVAMSPCTSTITSVGEAQTRAHLPPGVLLGHWRYLPMRLTVLDVCPTTVGRH